MSLYVMGDLHLSLAPNLDKPMDVFGSAWENHAEKIRTSWCLTDEDTIVLAGDLSWAMNFDELEPDLAFVDSLPGTKILLKGNHDYWWSTMSKMSALSKKYKTIRFLHNNSYLVDNVAVCGTRGWIAEPGAPEDELVLARECGRLKTSLASAKSGEKIVFLHYPPVFSDIRCDKIIQILKDNDVKTCFYGHLHGPSHKFAVNKELDGIDYRLISADFLNFKPFKVS